MTRPKEAALVALAALTLVACGTNTVVPATQVIVRVRVEPNVRADAAFLRINVEGGPNGTTFDRDPYTGNQRPLPALGSSVTVSLTPFNDDATRIYRVTARAVTAAGAEVAVARVISGYRAGETLEYELVIYGTCTRTCTATETCPASGGQCVSAEVDATRLSVLGDGGVATTDGGGVDGGARDAGHDAFIDFGASPIDECATGAPCGVGGTCLDTPSSFVCTCDAGYAAPGSGGTCVRCTGVEQCLAPDNTCGSVSVNPTRQTPNVILVIDQSGSMVQDFGGARRWDALRDSLLATPGGPIFSLQRSVRFGVAMYTSAGGGACPDLVTVPAAFDNHTTIEAEYAVQRPSGGTPTGDSITAVMAMIATLAPVRADPTTLILLTGGEPDTCEDGSDHVGGRRESLAAVTAAFEMAVQTFVVSVGSDVRMAHLQDIANAGLGRAVGGPDAEFWVATNAAGLAAALDRIIRGVTSCQLELEGSIDPTAACGGEVRFEGGPALACGTDWRAVDATHIDLLGAACERLQIGGYPPHITFPCDAIM